MHLIHLCQRYQAWENICYTNMLRTQPPSLTQRFRIPLFPKEHGPSPALSSTTMAGLIGITPLPPPWSLGEICSLGPEMPSLDIWPELKFSMLDFLPVVLQAGTTIQYPAQGFTIKGPGGMTWLRKTATRLALHAVPGSAQLCPNLIFCSESETSWTLALDS